MSDALDESVAERMERDLDEARAILDGRTAMLPEVRHLRAMQVHHEDSLIVIAMKQAKLHDETMAME